ncbi:MAG: AAA family ATPase [bacterium]|nr:AAA family ATPase [bacterium]
MTAELKKNSAYKLCHVAPAALPAPQLVFPLQENLAADEFPLDPAQPFVAQEQARRVIRATLQDTFPNRCCWLVGAPRCGRKTLVKYIASQTSHINSCEDQVLIPSSASPPLHWLALKNGEGRRLAQIAEDGLRTWQNDLLNSTLPLSETLQRLAENWQELSENPHDAISSYSREVQQLLAQRAALLRLRLLNGQSQTIDDLDVSLHRFLWGILNQQPAAPIQTSASDANALFGCFATRFCGDIAYCDHTTYSGSALLQARGSILIIDGEGLAQNLPLWQRLRRVLERGYLDLTELAAPHSGFPAWNYGLQIPLKTTVFIAISPAEYALLAENDEDLGMALPHKAEFADEDWLNETHKREFSAFAVSLAQKCGGPGIAIDGIAELLYYCSQRAAHAQRLNLQLGNLNEIVRRAGQLASQRHTALIKASDIEQALHNMRKSANLLEEELDYYTAGDIIHIETDTKAVGQVNGLTVIEQPEYSFGRPQRISAVVYASKDGLVAVERECQNDGKIHAKGTLILNGYILGCLGGLHTWPIGISVCMEQSYESIDGDSASSAEACAVLSALADVPIDQGIAVTGSIDQFGNIQAVGGIAEKVQGFYKLCAQRGLTGRQGVIIPRASLSEALFDRELRQALTQGTFHLWAVSHVSESIEILTGLPMGKLRDDRYPKRSIMGKIQMAADEADR